MKNRIPVMLLACLITRVASATVIVDQQYLTNNPAYILDYPEDYAAQTFTIHNSGQLVGIGLQVSLWSYSNDKPVTDDLLVRLIRTDAFGVPSINDVLASHTIDRNDVPFWLGYSVDTPVLEIDLADQGIHVEAGDGLAIAISSNHTFFSHSPFHYQDYAWHGQPFDPYPGGDFYVYSPRQYGPEPFKMADLLPPPNTRDMAFRVLIDTPEPSSLSMIVPLAMLLCWKKRPNQQVGCVSPTAPDCWL